jgi:thymidylate kinase
MLDLRARGYRNVQWIYEISECIIKPDLAFFLDIDVETAVKRTRSRREERERYIDMSLQYVLREEYLQIAQLNCGIVIPSDRPGEETFLKILEALNGY